MSNLFNLSLRTCKFPSKWKQAKIIPLHKGGSKDDVNNYRPISLLPLPGKLLEKIIHLRLMKYLEDNVVLSPNQHSFRPGHSTIDTVVDLADDICNALNEGKCTLAVYIDLKKAFDLANDTTSTSRNVICGVPQGSILGPLLSLCYINDLYHALSDSANKLYADDTVVYVHAVSIDAAHNMIACDIKQLENWCNRNRLTVNTTKTKVMLFGSRKFITQNHKPPIHINNILLSYVEDYTYLGITLDQNLNFRKHTQNVYKVAAHKVYISSKIRTYLTTKAALTIYKSKILPFIDYGDILYDSTYHKELGKLRKLQFRAARICLNVHSRTSREVLTQISVLPDLSVRRKVHLRNFMFKRKNDANIFSLINN